MRIGSIRCAVLAAGITAAAQGFATEPDPFRDMETRTTPQRPAQEPDWAWRLFHENFTFKKEVYSQLSYGSHEDRVYSRQSLGFEVLKKFSTRTATVASVNVQGRLVRRDGFVETGSDMEGASREGWFPEYHNLYADLYHVAGDLGRINVRAGRFYLPFGLNLQTDTHGTLLQLSNERNFGFERDWYAGFWGSLNEDLNYDAYYLLGSGYDLSFRGQSGMAGGRLSLANRHRNEHGLEGGLSFMGGQRIDPEAAARTGTDRFLNTLRAGPDARYTHLMPTGSLSLATELSAGHDDSDDVITQLVQVDYLTAGRRWGASTQYRRFWQDRASGPPADASVFGEIAWYLRNDIGGASLHSIRLNVERQLERQSGPAGTVVTLQYYRYW
jgi:hypothetical protein